MSGPFFKVGEIWREENKHNLQICHVAASTPRVNQGVQPWVSQRPLARFFKQHPEQAERIRLGLIHLLAEENHLFIEAKNPPPDSHEEDDVSEQPISANGNHDRRS